VTAELSACKTQCIL